jgi:hypothetical protein
MWLSSVINTLKNKIKIQNSLKCHPFGGKIVWISNKANSTYFTPKIRNLGFQRIEACASILWVGYLAHLVANIALVGRWVWLWVMHMACLYVISKHIHCCLHESKWSWTIDLWFLLIHHLIQFYPCCCFYTHEQTMYHDVNPQISTPTFPSREKSSCTTLRHLQRILLIMLLGLDSF